MSAIIKCCICHKIITGHCNNPNGALDYYGRPIKWKKSDRCCDECNYEHVIPGRVALLYKKVK